MKQINIARCFVGALVLLALMSLTAHAKPLVEKTALTAQILPKQYLRSYDPVTVVFSHNVGPNEANPEDKGTRYLRFQPPVTGAYRWLDASTLEFRPAQPWPALSRVGLFVPKGLTSKQSTPMLKDSSRVLRTMLPPPTKVKPYNLQVDVQRAKRIALTFPRPLPKATLQQALRVEIRKLPGMPGSAPEKVLTRQDWWLKQRNRGLGNTTYWIVLRRPLPKARFVTVKMQLALTSSQAKAPIPFWSSSFQTQQPFRLSKVQCGSEEVTLSQGQARYTQERALNCGSGVRVPAIHFSRPLGKNNPGLLRQLIRMSPTVAGLELRIQGNQLQLRGQYQRAVLYRLSILGGKLPIRDDAKQVLQHKGQQTVFFYLGRQSPILQWKQHQGILERWGPQMMPMQVRGTSKFDLRIHPIAPGDDRFWEAKASGLRVNETAPPPASGTLKKASNTVGSQSIYRTRSYLQTLGTPKVSRMVTLSGASSTSSMMGLNLAGYLQDLLPPSFSLAGNKTTNHFLVGLRRLNESTYRTYAMIQVTDLALATVEERGKVRFVVTSLKTAQPIKDASITIEGIEGTPNHRRWKKLWQGKTNALGFAVLDRAEGLQGTPSRIRVQSGSDRLLLSAKKAPPVFVSNHWAPSYRSWLAWLSHRRVNPAPETFRSHLFTERPVYRPGEDVHIKGIVRTLKEGRLTLPASAASKKLQLTVYGPKQRRWYFNNLKLTAMGGVYRKFSTKDAPVGSYRSVLYSLSDDGQKKQLSSRNFRVEAYRIPRFEVKVFASSKVPADKAFRVRAMAKYYAGGLVVEQPIQWRVTSRVVTYRPPSSHKGYHFASSHYFSRGPSRRTRVVIDRKDKIGKRGQASLKLNPTLHLDLYPRRYSVEATVRGADGRDVRGYRSMLVLPPFTIGMKLKQRFKLKPGLIQAKLIALDVKGKLAKDIPLKVTLLRREWHSHLVTTDFVKGGVKYRTEVVDKPVANCSVKTQSKDVTCPLNAKRSGVYILRVQGKDRLGRTQTLSLDLYVRGKQRIAWARSKKAVFRLSLDKKKYETGQSAKVLIRSPFQTARGLVIVEDPGGAKYHWVDIKGGQGLFRLPIERRYAPSLPVHVVLMQGRVAKPFGKKRIDPGRPRTVASSLRIPVDPKQHRVMVALKLAKQARPRELVDVEIQLRSPDGKPVAGEVTLWAVDRAVLSLGREGPLHPIKSFLKTRRSQIRIRDTRNLTVGRLPDRAERSGGGGGSGNQHRVVVRKNFKSVAYYNPAIVVGPTGNVKVRFRLPDDLTTFAVRAVAVNQAYRFGYRSRNIRVRLPVMIQRTLPRFVRPGDKFFSGGVGRVAEGDGGPAIATVNAQGLTILGEKQRKLVLPKRKAAAVFFPFAVPYRYQAKATVQMSLKRTKDGERDAFKITLPIQPDQRRVYLIREQMISSLGAPISMLSQWPEAIRGNSGKVEILVAGRGELIRTAAAMEYLLQYPYGCTEQRVSRAYPMLVLRNTLQQFASRHLTAKRIKQGVKETIQHLRSIQGRTGLYGFWPGSKGNLALTAYSVSFLLEARSAGYKFPSRMLNKPLRVLRRALRSDFVAGLTQQTLQVRAQILAALSQAQWHEPAYTRKLFAQRHKLDLFGQSQLLLAMSRDAERHGNRISLLSTGMEQRVLTQQGSTGPIFAGIQFLRKTPWYGSSLSSRTRTLAAMLEALSTARPKSKVIAVLQQGLLDSQISRKVGYGWQQDGEGMSWGSTQNNARALLAIRALLQHQQNKGLPKLAFQSYNSKSSKWSRPYSFGGSANTMWPFVIQSDQPPRFRFTGQQPQGLLWVRARLSYLPRVRGAMIKSLNKGLAVLRNTTVVAKKTKDESYFKVTSGKSQTVAFGKVLEESVRIIAGKMYSHVAVEVPIAAGLEVMDPSSFTASNDASPKQKNTLTPTHVEYLDDRVRFFFSHLPSGDHRLYFRVRATTSGTFTYPPARAELMYRPSVFGRSPGYTLVIQKAATK